MIENLFCSLVQSCTHFLGRISIICDICGNFVAASLAGALALHPTSPLHHIIALKISTS